MKFIRFSVLTALILVGGISAFGQKPEITITLNEPFFDAVLDALLSNGSTPEFLIADAGPVSGTSGTGSDAWWSNVYAFGNSFSGDSGLACRESIRMMRESGGVRTAVRFRDGQILAPLAFNGSYNPPLVGCVDFAGWAETAIDLEFDKNDQRLIARARVLNVSLNGTGGVGGNLIARMVQSSIDKRVNPIEIFRLEKLSFSLPMQNNGGMRMRATSVRHEVTNSALNIHVAYEFDKI
jgi:hypothetical protein